MGHLVENSYFPYSELALFFASFDNFIIAVSVIIEAYVSFMYDGLLKYGGGNGVIGGIQFAGSVCFDVK